MTQACSQAQSGSLALRGYVAQVDLNACNYVESTALACAAALGDLASVKRLLRAGASPRACDAEGLSPLHLAVRDLFNTSLPADFAERERPSEP